MSLLVLTHSGVSPRPHLPQESPCISSAGLAFTTISYSSTSTKININHITSPGETRAVTPGPAHRSSHRKPLREEHVSEGPAVLEGSSTKTVLCEQRRHTLCQRKEAKAVPAESIRPDRSRTVAIAYILAYNMFLLHSCRSTAKQQILLKEDFITYIYSSHSCKFLT